MKFLSRIFLIAVILFLSFTCSTHAGTKDTSSYAGNNNYTKASSVADTFYVKSDHTPGTRYITIENQSTDTLVIWFDNDSLSLKAQLLPGKTINYSKLLKSINSRSVTATAVRRQYIVKEH